MIGFTASVAAGTLIGAFAMLVLASFNLHYATTSGTAGGDSYALWLTVASVISALAAGVSATTAATQVRLLKRANSVAEKAARAADTNATIALAAAEAAMKQQRPWVKISEVDVTLVGYQPARDWEGVPSYLTIEARYFIDNDGLTPADNVMAAAAVWMPRVKVTNGVAVTVDASKEKREWLERLLTARKTKMIDIGYGANTMRPGEIFRLGVAEGTASEGSVLARFFNQDQPIVYGPTVYGMIMVHYWYGKRLGRSVRKFSVTITKWHTDATQQEPWVVDPADVAVSNQPLHEEMS